jgi:hypothetical protein
LTNRSKIFLFCPDLASLLFNSIKPDDFKRAGARSAPDSILPGSGAESALAGPRQTNSTRNAG